ncbi:MAG: hypothetical protein Unbinned1007contig1000_53 [Prokaryotic dsDNA virus sp.]|nr:MAG: hypothetical protein Unbinned1007contig1000_53 [Prokaryotic dsDNA virus sp.]|tara:strand:- start:8129 stop:8578 length:450 start_codon:yes stop_codon:yes gene_type:complete
MKNYKRSAIDRDITFRSPTYNCHACNDSGLVHNSDGLINNYLDDYDQRHDLAIICYCEAVYPIYNEEGQLVSHGFRDGDGLIKNKVGIDVDKDIIRELHNIRKKGWEDTARLMNRHIQKSIINKKNELPPEIQKVKQQVQNARSILPKI